MKDSKYLHNFPRFSPFTDFYKKIHFNPKIYKLAKLFSKNNLTYTTPDEKPKAHSIPRPKQPKKEVAISAEETQSKIPHLPKLPVLDEHKIIHSYEFRNMKLSNRIKNASALSRTEDQSILKQRKSSEPVSKNSVQTFNFSPLIEARTTSIPAIPAKLEDSIIKSRENLQKKQEDLNEKISESIKRKIIYSKRKQSVGVKDFSSFFDYQDGHIPVYSSFSNQ